MKPKPTLIVESLRCLEGNGYSKPMIFKGSLIENKYKGYIASFGGAVVQSGIMPACMQFCADEDKRKIAGALFNIFKKVYASSETNELSKYLEANWQNWTPEQRKSFRNKMSEIAVSFKLAMRTFGTYETGNENT